MKVSASEKQINWYEMDQAWNRFWSKNRLDIDENGKVYLTNIPRIKPKGLNDPAWNNFKKKRELDET